MFLRSNGLLVKEKYYHLIYFLLLAIPFHHFVLGNQSLPSYGVCEETSNFVYKKGRVFDIFMYNNEASMAYVRIWREAPYVDYFIIVFSNVTLSGQKRQISFKEFEKDLEPYKDKLIFAYFNGECDSSYKSKDLNWCRETTQRNYGFKYYQKHLNPQPDDLLLVSDCDEIFTRESIQYFIQFPPEKYVHAAGVYYFPLYFHRMDEWNGAIVARYYPDFQPDLLRTIILRGKKRDPTLVRGDKPLVTHCSYCFRTLDEYKKKIQSFAHQEFNKPPYTTNDWIFQSHYCRFTVNSKKFGIKGYDEPDTDITELIPNDERLRFLYDPSYTYDITLTSYKEEDLPTLCDEQWRRSL